MEKFEHNQTRIPNYLGKLGDELPFNGHGVIRKMKNHLDETENEINFGRHLLNEQDITGAFPKKKINKKTYKYEDENALFNRPLNIYNYKKIQFPTVIYNPRNKNESNPINDNITVKTLLTKIEKYNIRNRNSINFSTNKNKKNFPTITNKYFKISPIKLVKDNRKNDTFTSTIFNTTSCDNFNKKIKKNNNNNLYYSPMLHKNLQNVFQTIDDKTTRSNELSEKIKKGIDIINEYKLNFNNKNCFSVKKCNINKVSMINEPFDEKDIKKFPLISQFNNIGKTKRLEQIQEVLFKNNNKKLYKKILKIRSKKKRNGDKLDEIE